MNFEKRVMPRLHAEEEGEGDQNMSYVTFTVCSNLCVIGE